MGRITKKELRRRFKVLQEKAGIGMYLKPEQEECILNWTMRQIKKTMCPLRSKKISVPPGRIMVYKSIDRASAS